MATVLDDNGYFVFSGMAKDIVLDGLTGDVTVSLNGSEYRFSPYEGKVTLHFHEMIENVANAIQVEAVSLDPGEEYTIVVDGGGFSNREIKHLVKHGDCSLGNEEDSLPDIMRKSFLTNGSATQQIYDWSRIHLTYATDKFEGEGSGYDSYSSILYLSMDVELYGDLETINLEFPPVQADSNYLWHGVSLDINRIKELFEESSEDISEVEYFYNIKLQFIKQSSGGGIHYSSPLMKYEFAGAGAPNFREFIFINQYGVTDQVFSRGQIKILPDGEFYSFVNRGHSRNSGNTFRKFYEVNTGRFKSAKEREQWFDFFRSEKHYLLLGHSDILKEIVIDEVKADTVEYSDGAATFKFHFSDPSPVIDFNKNI